MSDDDLKERTKAFALRIMSMVKQLPKTYTAQHIGHQIVRSGTSIGANYREARVGKSRADFAAKLAICQGEAEETVYWLELLMDDGMLPRRKLEALHNEASQIAAIFAASVISARKKM